MHLIYVFLAFALFSSTYGQHHKRHKRYYEMGKVFLAKQQYHQAYQIFTDLNSKKTKPIIDLHPYILFYWAISAYHLSKKQETLYASEKILREYPNWAKLDEVHYLIGLVSMEGLKGLKAFRHFKYIQDSSFLPDIKNVLDTYIGSLPYQMIADLYQIYPDDTIIGKTFYQRLKDRPKMTQETAIFEKLKVHYNLSSSSKPRNTSKSKYKIAILLPKGKDQTADNINPILLEFVLAAKLAARELQVENINFEFFIFNIQDDSTALARFRTTITDQPCDVFLSLVYKDYFKPIYDLALELEIPFLTLTAKKMLVENNTFICSLLPNLETLVEQGIMFVLDSLKRSKVYIIKDEATDSGWLSNLYRKIIENAGGAVQDIITLNNDKGNFEQNLQELKEDIELIQDSLHLMHAFIITKSENILRHALALLKTAHFKGPIIGQQHWLDSRQVPLSQMEQDSIYFLINYLIEENQAYWAFIDAYAQSNKKIPNIYAKLGYIATHFLAYVLNQYGLDFYKNLYMERKIKIRFFSDIYFKIYNNNQNSHVCILKDGRLIKLK